jgi:biopolymer transport protein ExbB/TolQ
VKNRWNNVITSFGLALATWLIALIVGGLSPDKTFMSRLLQIMGSDFPEGLVQFFTFWLFYFGILEIRSILQVLLHERKAFGMNLLPELEQYVLSPSDVNDVKLKVMDVERRTGAFILTDLIKKACTKFRANKSSSEALEIVAAQVRINLSNSVSEQSMIRYVAWAIPSVGFIGTIIGIASSLGNVKAEMDAGDIQGVTQALYLAFDTTLLSLFLSILLMFYFHFAEEKVERFHTEMEAYLIENLINRIYKN